MTTTYDQSLPLQHLQALGFSEYEARAYVGLLEAGQCTGYALAKSSGIPRANVYAVLDKLAERGAVLRGQGQGGRTWSAVPAETLLGSLGKRHAQSLAEAARALAGVGRTDTPATVFNLRGDELVERARQLIDAARDELLVAIQPREAARLAASLRDAHERGVEITTLCLEACAAPCGGCQGQLHRRQLAPDGGDRWLVLAADGHQGLVGQWRGDCAQGVSTTHPLVVELAAAYVCQSLALALIDDELVGRVESVLSGQARHWLAAANRGGRASPVSER